MIIIDSIQQGTDEWIQEKIGKPSASNASRIITNSGKPSTQREGYLYELAGEALRGKKEEGYKNRNMEIGNEREDESRKLFEIIKDVEVEQVGVIYKDDKKQFLCSPDGLINREEGLELKNVLPKTQVKYLLNDKLPSEYFGQIQMSLFITGFKCWWFMSYVDEIRPLIIRCEPDADFQIKLRVQLELFCSELLTIINKLKQE